METKKELFLIVSREGYLSSCWIDEVDDPKNPKYYGEKIEDFCGEFFVKYDSPFSYAEIKENSTVRSLIEVDRSQISLLLSIIDGVNCNGVEGCTTYLYAYKVSGDDFEYAGEVEDDIECEPEHCQVFYNGKKYDVASKHQRGIGSIEAWKTWQSLELSDNEIHKIGNL